MLLTIRFARALLTQAGTDILGKPCNFNVIAPFRSTEPDANTFQAVSTIRVEQAFMPAVKPAKMRALAPEVKNIHALLYLAFNHNSTRINASVTALARMMGMSRSMSP